MYKTIMGELLIGIFVLYVVCSAGADRKQYEDELRYKYGDNL